MRLKPLSVMKGLLGKPGEPADPRNRRFVAVIECTLNQNVRDAGAACFPAMNFKLLELCQQHGVGILQMPCPEIAALGSGRQRPPGQSLREALDSENGRFQCHILASETADRIDGYLAQGNELAAVLGGNPRSPGCAVHEAQSGLGADSGVFMKALQAELRRRGHDAPFHGIRDHDPALLREDLMWLKQRLSRD